MSHSSGLMDLRKFVFCFLIDVWINSKIYLNVSELILKYLQNLSSSLSKSSRRLWNSPKLSRLELILCTQKRLFLENKRLLHQILSINENTRAWFDILAVQMSAALHSVRVGWACNVNVLAFGIWQGRRVNALCANRPAREVTKRILLRKWLCGWQVVISWCCVQHSELLVFHACSATNYPFRGCVQSFPTNVAFESS